MLDAQTTSGAANARVLELERLQADEIYSTVQRRGVVLARLGRRGLNGETAQRWREDSWSGEEA